MISQLFDSPANDIWKLGWTMASGASSRTPNAAIVSVRKVSVGTIDHHANEHDGHHHERTLGRESPLTERWRCS